MSKIGFVAISGLFLFTVCAGSVHAADISATKIIIKDNAKPEKRQVQVQSKDVSITYASADDPLTNGASLHIYSATDDWCAVLPAGAEWSTNGKKWKYKNKLTKNQAQIADRKLLVKFKSAVAYSLADDGTQGTVNAQVQFANGTRYCMQCSAAKKDDAKKFIAVKCAAAVCDAEPSLCDPFVTTTTTTIPVTTTTLQAPGTVLQGVLIPTTGRFNYNLTLGLPGAEAACAATFAGSHVCEISELQNAEAAGDLVGRTDTAGALVTHFWAIDPARPNVDQCTVSIPWDYQTAHTGQFADRTNLDNGAGTLGPLFTAACLGSAWVGCCL